ncbi:MAG: DUF3775 domain-containing protein [Alphaproteobacteria bacterium]|jgi:hypothetical protein|nr:DUF3775 domain-containing protein [Alphaproteobacteria bacterium]
MDNLNPEKVFYIIVKARGFDVKVDPLESNPGTVASNDDDRDVLEDFADDATFDELTGAIDALNEDEVIELVALTWTGRGDYTADQWPDAVAEARRAHNDRTAAYLTGIPLLGDYLEEGLSVLGYSCEEYEAARL